MADIVVAPARLRMRSIALNLSVSCIAAVLLWIAASFAYSIGYTLVGPKTQGRVRVTGCDTVVSNTRHFGDQSSTSCVGTFVSADGSVRLKDVDVHGAEPDAIDHDAQLVRAVRKKPATVYVGSVLKGQGADLGFEGFVLFFGLVAAASAFDVYKRRRFPPPKGKPTMSTDHRNERPVS